MIPLDLPTYDLDGWGGNYSDDDGVDWVVVSEDGWASPPGRRVAVEDRPLEDGADDGPGYDSARTITLTGTAIASSRLDQNLAKDRFHGAAAGRGLYTLTVREEHLTRIAYVRRIGDVKIGDRGGLAFDWSITLLAADPRKYAATQREFTVAPQAPAGTGRTYFRTYPMIYGDVGTTDAEVGLVENLGNYPTGAVIDITGGIVRPVVTNLRTGAAIGFDISLAAGDTLTVDLLARTVVLNGTTSRRSTLLAGSSWWLHESGTTPLRLGGALAGGGAPRMTVRYRPAWK
jgi:hypothetical protein